MHLNIILKTLSEKLGVSPECRDFLSLEWTKEQEEEFLSWMASYLYNNAEARKELMRFPKKGKEACRMIAEKFVFYY